MSEREHGVREDHSRPRPLHHVLYLLPHIRHIAMDFTEGTEFFVDLERAFFEAEERIFGERSALFTYFVPSRSVFAVAILSYHHGDELFLLLPRFQFFWNFIALRFFHDLPLFRRSVRVCEPMDEKLGTQ